MHVPLIQRAPSRRRRRLTVPSAAVLALALGLAACGTDDIEDATTTTSASPDTTEAEPTDDSEGDLAAFCDAVLEVDAIFAAGGPEGPDPSRLGSAMEEARTTAPPDIADDVDRLITLTQEALDSAEQLEGPPPPEVEELDANVDEYVLANCDLAEIEVTGTEYDFEGLSEEIEAGQTAFTFTNEGQEQHELVVVRINDDVTESLEEIAQLPEEEAFTKVEVKGFAMAPPGGTDHTFVDLEPGRYGALCFFPVGSTPEALAAVEESGEEIDAPPHFSEGMLAEFTVE